MNKASSIYIRYVTDYADQGTKELLREDRKIRSSLRQTTAQMSQGARKAAAASTQNTAAARRQASAHQQAGRAAQTAARGTQQAGKASEQAARSHGREAVSARRVAQSYDQIARQAKRAAAEQRRSRAALAAAAGGAASAAAGPAKAGIAGAAAGALGAFTIGASFEKQMDKVGATANATGRQFKQLSELAKQLGADTSFSARDAAAGMAELTKAGFTANQTMKVIPGTLDLAAASGVELAEAASLQANAIRGFGLSANDATRVADVLAKTVNASAVDMADLGETFPYVASAAKATGTSFEQVAAAAGILGNAGIKGSQAGTALRTSMLRLTDPTKKMQATFQRMGIDSAKLAAIPLPQAIGKIAAGLQKLPTRGEKVGALSAIFGKEAAPAMLTLMDKGKAGIDRLVKTLTNSKGAAKETAKEMRDNVAGAFDEFTGSVENAGISLTEKFNKPLKEGFKGAARGVNQLVAGLTGQRRTETVSPAGDRGGGSVKPPPLTGMEKAGVTIRTTIGDIGRVVGPALGKAGKAIGKFAADMVDAFKPATPFLKNVVLPLAAGVAMAIVDLFKMIGKILPPVVKVVATAIGAIGRVLKPLRPLFFAVGYVIGTVFGPWILKAVGGALSIFGRFGKVLGVVFRAAGSVVNTFFRIFGGAVRLITAGFGKVAAFFSRGASVFAGWASKVGGVFKRVGTAIGSAGGRIIGAARSIVSAIGRGFSRLAGLVSGAVSRALGLARRVISGAASRYAAAAKAVAGAVSSAFSAVVSRVPAAIRSAFSAAVKTIRNWLGRAKGAASDVAGGIVGAFTSVADKIGKAFDKVKEVVMKVVDTIKKAVDKIPDVTPWDGATPFNTGGVAGGSLALVSPGELAVLPTGRAAIVPGRPVAADNVLASFPAGTEIYTGHGQQLLAAGATRQEALAHQLPHFAKGGVVGASVYGLGEAGTGTRGYRGDSLPGRMAFAELNMGRALGGLPYRAALDITYKGRTVTARKLDIGRGGGSVAGRPRAIDLWRDTARALRFPNGVGLVRTSKGTGREGTRGRGGSTKIALPPKLSFAAGLQGPIGAFQAGYQGGIEGSRLEDIESVRELASAATARLEKRSKTIANRSGGGARTRGGHGGFAPGGGWAGTQNLVMHAIRGIGQRQSFKRSVAINGNQNSDHNEWIKNAFAADISPGGDRVFALIARRLGIAARKGSWNTFPNAPLRGFRSQLLWQAPDGSHRDHVHLGIRKLRRGGLIPAFRGGGITDARKRIGSLGELPSTSSAAIVARSLRGLARVLDNTTKITYGRLEGLRKSIERQAKALRKGGVTQRERVQLRRLGAADRLVATEMGRRTGLIVRGVDRQREALERARTRLSQQFRTMGIDEASSAAMRAARDLTASQLGQLKAMQTSLTRALARARRVKDRAAIRDITERLAVVRDDIAETAATWAEQVRQAIQVAAQEQVDLAGARASLASIGLQRLELQQRLAGTFETGGQARADYINQTILPALRTEIAALEAQYQTAATPAEQAAILQALEQKRNDVLQAQLDALEQIKDNTQSLKEFDGTTTFEFAGQQFTDLVGVGTGA